MKKIISLMADMLMEKFRICPYYCGDEEPCRKAEEREDIDSGHLTCNCNGDIRECDLPDKFFENK